MRKNLLHAIFASACALVLCLAIPGCGGSKYTQIGEAADGVPSVLIDNGLGEAVTAFSVREAGEDAYPASLLAEGAAIAADETAQLNYAWSDGVLYDLAITTESGKTVEVRDVPLSAFDHAAVKFEDGVGFIVYTDAEGNEVSTKQSALDRKAAEEKLAADTDAAAAVTSIILALPSGDAVTLDGNDAIVAAREAYDALTDDQKALVAPDALAHLEAAEQGYAAAEKAEADRIAAEEAAAAEAEAAAAAAAEAESEYYEDYSDYSYDYSAPTQSTEDCTSDTIPLRP